MAKTNTEKIDLILEAVQSIRERNAKRDVQIDNILVEMTNLNECIDGNGKPGLRSKVEELQHNQKITSWVGGIIGGAVLAEFASKIIGLLR